MTRRSAHSLSSTSFRLSRTPFFTGRPPQLTTHTHTSQTKQRILRAKAAADNGFESVGVYAAAIAAATAARVPAETLNTLALSYVVSRVAYNIIYVFLQDNRKFAPVRSLTWTASVGIIFTLWIKAGNAAAAALSV